MLCKLLPNYQGRTEVNQEKIKSLNQQIWDQVDWGFNKVAQLLEHDLLEELK